MGGGFSIRGKGLQLFKLCSSGLGPPGQVGAHATARGAEDGGVLQPPQRDAVLSLLGIPELDINAVLGC